MRMYSKLLELVLASAHIFEVNARRDNTVSQPASQPIERTCPKPRTSSNNSCFCAIVFLPLASSAVIVYFQLLSAIDVKRQWFSKLFIDKEREYEREEKGEKREGHLNKV